MSDICQWTGLALVQVMACHLFGTKPLPEPMLAYCQLDSWKQISVKFESKFYHFHSSNYIWDHCLPKWQLFCPEGVELIPHVSSNNLLPRQYLIYINTYMVHFKYKLWFEESNIKFWNIRNIKKKKASVMAQSPPTALAPVTNISLSDECFVNLIVWLSICYESKRWTSIIYSVLPTPPNLWCGMEQYFQEDFELNTKHRKYASAPHRHWFSLYWFENIIWISGLRHHAMSVTIPSDHCQHNS